MLDNACHVPDAILDRQREAWLKGDRPTVQDLLSGTPFENEPEAHLDVLYHQLVVEEELGLNPTLDNYVRQYPHLSEDLKLHFEVHRAIDEQLLLDTEDPDSAARTWPKVGAEHHEAGLPQEDYEVLRQLGQGGMAVVYQARDRRLNRDVALKIFQHGRNLTSREVARIRTEAEAMARLTHPNIVQIFEIGQCDGLPFLALELAEQGTLAEKLQQFPFPPQAAAELIATLAGAIQHAHGCGIVHRDLKPANVLFAKDGTPKITDFGLAKVRLDEDLSLHDATRTGEAIGTPRYMAPEQASVQHDLVGPATDVYALGTLLYECLTGRPPFVAAGVIETLRRICHNDPLPPRRLQSGIPRDLETICLHCLQKDPSRRYSSAEALADDLHRFGNGEPIHARPTPHWERAWKWCRRKPTHAALIACGLVVVLGGMTAAFVNSHLENQRVASLRNEVASLMHDGRSHLEQDESDAGYARFQEAWEIVQAEPSLSDHRTSVTGWMDFSRNAANQYQWKQRIPPRPYDERRDEALLLSLLVIPHQRDPLRMARQSIKEALGFTLADDRIWQVEREQLILLDSVLAEREAGAAQALALLEDTQEFSSRAYHLRRAELLSELGRSKAAAAARAQAEEHPPETVSTQFATGMERVRDRQFQLASASFDEVLASQPANFTARLFQAICFLHLGRPHEAKVGLTACIAQRPEFSWNYYFLARAFTALDETSAALRNLQLALDVHASDAAQLATLLEMGTLQMRLGRPDDAQSTFTRVTEQFPEEISGWTQLARIERQLRCQSVRQR